MSGPECSIQNTGPPAARSALPGATALVQARATGVFTAAHEAFWAAARKAHGDAGGTQALIEVLLLHRHQATDDVITGISAALAVGSTNPDVVAVETRKAAAACDAHDTDKSAVQCVRRSDLRIGCSA